MKKKSDSFLTEMLSYAVRCNASRSRSLPDQLARHHVGTWARFVS